MLNEKGQTILEVVVVIAVVLIVAGALVFATVFSLRNSNFAKSQTQATKLAQEGLEEVRTQRDRNGTITGIFGVNNWNDDSFWTVNKITSTCPSLCYFIIRGSGLVTSGAEQFGQFHRAIILEDEGDGTTAKKITAIVQWTDATGSHESRLSTVLRKI